ncbi:MAG: transposase [Caldilineaceae bacterium]|nr:transposase [Caldilineaceae bacterium]
MATIIQLRDQPFTDACPTPDRCEGCGAATWHGHGTVLRTVTDLQGDRAVSVRRYRCQACGLTVTMAPAGVDAKGRTQRLRAYLVLLYCLGLSHRGVEEALAPLGVQVDHVTVWRDLQALGARMQARGPVGTVRVVMLDETWIPIGGGKRPVAVVTDAGDGTILQLAISDGDFDWQAWLKPLAGWGVEVVVTDDDSAYGAPLEAHGLDRQQCMVHMRRTFTRRLRKLPEEVRERYAPRLKRLRVLLRELPAEGAGILMGWLEEAIDPEAPAPKEWRCLVQHFLERWNQMRIHGRAPDVPATTHRLEGRFGRLKPRVRRARGFPTRAGARNFLHAVTHVCA